MVLGGSFVTPLLWRSTSSCIGCHFWFGSLEGMMPLLYSQWVSLFGWVGAFHIRKADYLILQSDTGVTYQFHSPHFVWPCLPWPSSVIGHIPLWVHYPPTSMGIDVIPATLHICSFWGLQPNYFTCVLHPSLVDAPVDIHGRGCNFPFFHPREASLEGHCVTTLPLFSCGILSFLTPVQVVLHGVGLVHMPHVWWLPIHKGKPISDAMRRSQFWWRTHNHPCWFVTL